MATAPQQEISELRRKMALIRHELHEDVRGVVEGAEAATDWRSYIRNYPWAGVAVAFAIGYLVVPRKRHPAPTIQFGPAEIARAVSAEAPRAAEPEKKKGKGLFRSALGLIVPVVFRAGQGYALQFFEQWMAEKMAQQQGGFGDLAAAFGAPQPQQPPPPQAPASGPQARPPGSPRFS